MIFIAGDKHGFSAIQYVISYLTDNNIAFKNLGVLNGDADEKLENFLPKIASNVLSNHGNSGIVSCGAGIGVEVGINKFKGIRACLANQPKIAKWGKIYDMCNVLCIPGWEINKETIYSILDEWFSNSYDGNVDRLKMFKAFDSWK